MVIDRFVGPYRWLSNFWPCVVILDGSEYRSVEHAYQAAKTLDPREREEFRKPDTTSAMAKAMGKHVTQRADWHEVRIPVMTDLVWQKFSTNQSLADLLIETGQADIVEGNWWNDVFWGVCRGVGHNHLGKILMAVRDRLNQQGEDHSS